MPITDIDPPAGLEQAVRATLDQLGAGRPAARAEDAATPTAAAPAPSVGRSAPLYLLRLDRIAAGAGLETATPNGWRTFVHGTADGIAIADSAVGDRSGHDSSSHESPVTVRQVSRGPAVAGLADAADGAEEAAADADYELRILQVPGISFTAVWLHALRRHAAHSDSVGRTSGSEAGVADDRLIPAAPTPPGVAAGRVIGAAALLDQVRPLAVERVVDDPSRAKSD